MFYQCIPGSGKTWLCRHAVGFVDSDDAMRSFAGEASSKGYNLLKKDTVLRTMFNLHLLELSDKGMRILCNFDPTDFGLPEPAVRFAYHPDEYVAHLVGAERGDLLTLGSVVLRSWARDYRSKANVMWLPPGTYVAAAFGVSSLAKLIN